MAISIKEITNKQFSFQESNGYNCDEVDDFLDALAAQMTELVRENMALKEKANAAPAPAPVADGEAYDEPSYFKNLEQAMRETLISSQRIADETIADARKKAAEILSAAQEQADSTAEAARAEVEAAKTKIEGLKGEVNTFRAQALQSLDVQQHAIDEMRAALKQD